MLHLLSYPPIIRGFIVLLSLSALLPITGVWVLRLNLLPYRFMLMHGSLLGGAIALAFNLSQLPVLIITLFILIILADSMANQSRLDAGQVTIFLMTASLGGAMALLYGAQVSAQNTLGLLWGSLFVISSIEVVSIILFCTGLAIFARVYHLKIQAVIFDRDAAFTAGVNDTWMMRILLILIGLIVAFAMRIIGALLLDALLLVPVIIGSTGTRSLAGLYKRSVITGIGLGLSGFATSLATDLPVGATTALAGALVLGITLIIKH